MPATTPCIPCCSEPTVTNVPGPSGLAGPQGPQGEQGEPGETPELDVTAAYSAGTAYTMTASQALLAFGTTSPSVTLTVAGRYAIWYAARFDLNGATYAANQTITTKLRCVNNTIADLTNSSRVTKMPIVTTLTYTLPKHVAYVEYTATAGDVVQMFGAVSALPGAGTVTCEEAEIFALKLD